MTTDKITYPSYWKKWTGSLPNWKGDIPKNAFSWVVCNKQHIEVDGFSKVTLEKWRLKLVQLDTGVPFVVPSYWGGMDLESGPIDPMFRITWNAVDFLMHLELDQIARIYQRMIYWYVGADCAYPQHPSLYCPITRGILNMWIGGDDIYKESKEKYHKKDLALERRGVKQFPRENGWGRNMVVRTQYDDLWGSVEED
jgi:hypothetical protein